VPGRADPRVEPEDDDERPEDDDERPEDDDERPEDDDERIEDDVQGKVFAFTGLFDGVVPAMTRGMEGAPRQQPPPVTRT